MSAQFHSTNGIPARGSASVPPRFNHTDKSMSYLSNRHQVSLSLASGPRVSIPSVFNQNYVRTSPAAVHRSKSTPPAIINAVSDGASNVSEITMGGNGLKEVYVMPETYLPTYQRNITLELAKELFPTAHKFFKKAESPFPKNLPSDPSKSKMMLERFHETLKDFHKHVKALTNDAFFNVRVSWVRLNNIDVTRIPDTSGEPRDKLNRLSDDVISSCKDPNLLGVKHFRDCDDAEKKWIRIVIDKIEEEYQIKVANYKNESWVVKLGFSVQDVFKKRIRQHALKTRHVDLRMRAVRKNVKSRSCDDDDANYADVFGEDGGVNASFSSDISSLTWKGASNDIAAAYDEEASLGMNTSFGSGLGDIADTSSWKGKLLSDDNTAAQDDGVPVGVNTSISCGRERNNYAATSNGSANEAKASTNQSEEIETNSAAKEDKVPPTNEATASTNGSEEIEKIREPEKTAARSTRSGRAGTYPVQQKKKVKQYKRKINTQSEETDNHPKSECECFYCIILTTLLSAHQ